MKIAIVHDYLTQRGGAERVVLAFNKCFPDAPIYTSIYSKASTFSEFQSLDIRVSKLQRFIPGKMFGYAAPLYSSAFESIDLSPYDAVLVSSSGFAHHIKHDNAYIYCHTPPRFIYNKGAYGGLKAVAWPMLPWFKKKDVAAASRHLNYAANSIECARRIKTAYGKSVPVYNPPLLTHHLPLEVHPLPAEPRALIVARLMEYKRFDLAIAACKEVGIPLTIVGDGPDRNRLEKLANSDTSFLGSVKDSELPEIFNTHSIVLMPGIEDFGLAAIEANYAGRPVVARGSGGALESVADGENGVLINSDGVKEWAGAIKVALNYSWSPESIRESTRRFQLDAYCQSIRNWVLKK